MVFLSEKSFLEEAGDDAVLIDVDALGGRDFRQAGHGHDVTGEGDDEAGAGGDFEVADRDAEIFRCALLGRVIGEGVLGLGHADRHLVEAELFELLELLRSLFDQVHAVGMVDLRSDGFQFFHDGGILVVAELEVRRLFAETDDFFGQGDAAFAAFCPDFGQSDVDAEFVALRFDEVEFGLGVGRERVDGDDDRETVDVLDVIDVLEQVRKTGFQSFEVFVVQVGFRDTAVVLEGTDGSDDDDGGGSKACHAALDVEELLGTEVGTEAGFRNEP